MCMATLKDALPALKPCKYNFFDFPPEIRNQIYDELRLIDRPTTGWKDLLLWRSNDPPPELPILKEIRGKYQPFCTHCPDLTATHSSKRHPICEGRKRAMWYREPVTWQLNHRMRDEALSLYASKFLYIDAQYTIHLMDCERRPLVPEQDFLHIWSQQRLQECERMMITKLELEDHVQLDVPAELAHRLLEPNMDLVYLLVHLRALSGIGYHICCIPAIQISIDDPHTVITVHTPLRLYEDASQDIQAFLNRLVEEKTFGKVASFDGRDILRVAHYLRTVAVGQAQHAQGSQTRMYGGVGFNMYVSKEDMAKKDEKYLICDFTYVAARAEL